MDSIDALGFRPDRHKAFTGELLARAEDDVLQHIVEEAARELSVPIALVNLVLEEIQFFKAHYGLPLDLAAAQGTERDVSFCQFVVRDGQPFEVTDAERDFRVPQHLVKHHGIRSYLGIPVGTDDIIVGSLCVIDTKPRQFSTEERRALTSLAELVSARLTALSKSHQELSTFSMAQTATPALAELRESLAAIRDGAAAGLLTTTALDSFISLMKYKSSGGDTPPEHLSRTIEAAVAALDSCENSFYNIEANAGDAEDARLAFEHLLTQTTSTTLSELAVSGRELARRSAVPIGGITLPELTYDPTVATPRPLGVTLVTTCLSIVAARLANLGLMGGIHMNALDLGSLAAIDIEAKKLPDETFQTIAAEMNLHTGETPSVVVQAIDGGIRLSFAVIQRGSR